MSIVFFNRNEKKRLSMEDLLISLFQEYSALLFVQCYGIGGKPAVFTSSHNKNWWDNIDDETIKLMMRQYKLIQKVTVLKVQEGSNVLRAAKKY